MSVRCSTRADGDFHLDRVDRAVLAARRRRLVDLPWTMLDEVHGTEVVTVDRPGAADRRRGDVLVTDLDDAALGVWAGDCAPVVLVHPDGPFAMVHAGWRGLAAGVLDVACDALGLHGDRDAVALLGPAIGPCCYEFGDDDLAAVAAAVGAHPGEVAGTTAGGGRSLDVAAAVEFALARRGVVLDRHGACTGCGGAHFSHRVRADEGRHVVVAWRTR